MHKIDKMGSPEEYLEHYGIKGMKWGGRRSPEELAGIRSGTKREAKKDAKESASAKMFYGEGAGTRRKLQKAKVESKAKKDSSYKKAYDHYLNEQDLGKHASKARSERKRKDVVSGTAKTARGVHRSLVGGFGSVTLASAAIAGAYTYAKKTGADKIAADIFKSTLSDLKSSSDKRKNMKVAKDFLKDMGL